MNDTFAIALIATVAAMLGGFVLYLGSPNQQFLKQSLSARGSLIAGGVALALSFVMLTRLVTTSTAVYTLFTLVMLVWTVLPLGIAFVRYRKEQKG